MNIRLPNTVRIMNLIFEYSFVLIKYAYRANRASIVLVLAACR